ARPSTTPMLRPATTCARSAKRSAYRRVSVDPLTRQPAELLRFALRLRADHDVDHRRLVLRHRRLQRRLQLVRRLTEVAITAKRLDDALVVRVRVVRDGERRAVRVERARPAADAVVVDDDEDDRHA